MICTGAITKIGTLLSVPKLETYLRAASENRCDEHLLRSGRRRFLQETNDTGFMGRWQQISRRYKSPVQDLPTDDALFPEASSRVGAIDDRNRTI